MRRFHRRGDDRGVSLVEVAISMLILSMVGVAAITWLMAAGTSDRFQEDAAASVDALRQGKVALVSELRFGDALSTDPDLTNDLVVTVWIDRVDAGQEGTPEPGVGEWVTWEITQDGRLVRTTDIEGDPPLEVVRGLVVGDGGSGFSYPAPGVVGIRLVADALPSRASEQTIQTQVRLRNS